MLVDVGDVELYCEQYGAGEPNVLLIPGLGANTHVWYSQIRDLSPLMRVTAMDLRGHGRSGKPHGPYRISMLADDVAGLIQHLDQGPAVVVASSMATLAAVELAATNPDCVSALVLVGGFTALSEQGRERFSERARLAETLGIDAFVDQVVGAALSRNTHATQPALVGLYRQTLLSNDPHAYAAACRALVSADVTPRLSEVGCPVFILLGEQEQVAPLPSARALKAGMPHARIEVLPHAGHLPFLEQPAAFNAAIQRFVAGL